MIITASKITNLSDINFDAFFEASLPMLDAEENYWPIGITSYDDKKNYIIMMFNCTNSMPNPCFFKMDADGRTVTVSFGFINNGQHHILVGLLRDDANGSRNYIYDAGWAQALKDIAIEHGATSGLMHLYTDSKSCETFKDVFSATESDLTYIVSENSLPVTILKIW